MIKGEFDFTKKLIRENLNEQLNAFQDILTPTLLFDDSIAAKEIIDSFSYNPQIEGAVLWRKNESSNTSPTFSKFASTEGYEPKPIFSDFEIWDKETLTITKKIGPGNRPLGYLSLSRSLSDLSTRKEKFIGFGLVSWILMIVVVVIVTLWYQSNLTRPMKELMRVAEKISVNKDYNLRAQKITNDEFGRLTNIFNEMMDSLDDADQKLREANNQMENKVKLRTQELSDSNKMLVKEMEQREKTHTELLQTKEKLNRQEKLASVGQVSSNIAHELRNPMTAIRNAVFFLRSYSKSIEDSKALHHLDVIDNELTQSDEVIQRLLELTKGEKIKLINSDLRKIAHDAFLVLNPPTNIQFKVNFQEATKDVKVDPLLFRQILTNLYTNSIQAMPAGGQINLSAKKSNEWIEIRVSDEGEGINSNLWSKVFDPLYTNKKDGVGLGLSLCKELIERHNGNIEIEASSKNGTTFLLSLPAPKTLELVHA